MEPTSHEEKLKKFAEVLESWPLYRQYEYARSTPSSTGAIKSPNIPQEIELFCRECGGNRKWRCEYPFAEAVWGTFFEKRYSCKNCGSGLITFFLALWESRASGLFFKVGQHPPLGNEPPKELKLDESDRDLYKKALNNRNASYGLGALAYLRRVVENRMDALLDCVAAAAEASGQRPEPLDEVRRSWSFDRKAEFAKSLLPDHLKPGGHNPLDALHDLASAGIHDKTEEECLEAFDLAKIAFEYVFTQLTTSAESAQQYVETLNEIVKRHEPK